MYYADLHIHSTYSDGEFSPEEIVDNAVKKGIKCISITDHDTIASQYIIEQNNNNIEIIPGIEFSTEYNNIEIHILGYYIDINNKVLIDSISKIQQNRYDRAVKIIEKLNHMDINVSINDLKKNNNDVSYGRGNIASAIAKKGYAKNFKDAFLKFLDKNKPAYVKGNKLDYKDVLDIIKKSNGISVLAHPGKIYRTMSLEGMIKELKCYGLNGIEVYHPSHSNNQKINFYNLAVKNKLIITGGSDFHSATRFIPSVGSCGIDEKIYNKLKKSII